MQLNLLWENQELNNIKAHTKSYEQSVHTIRSSNQSSVAKFGKCRQLTHRWTWWFRSTLLLLQRTLKECTMHCRLELTQREITVRILKTWTLLQRCLSSSWFSDTQPDFEYWNLNFEHDHQVNLHACLHKKHNLQLNHKFSSI